jgi:hypothetical protein
LSANCQVGACIPLDRSSGVTKHAATTEGQLESDASFMVRLPGSSTSFALLDGFLVRGAKYKMAVGTVTGEGNISFVESSFKTEK